MLEAARYSVALVPLFTYPPSSDDDSEDSSSDSSEDDDGQEEDEEESVQQQQRLPMHLPVPSPLHFACQAESPHLLTILYLLRRNFQSESQSASALDNTGSLPLHYLCVSKPQEDALKFLLLFHGGAVQTNHGDLPFMVACKTRASEGVMYRLLRAYPDALEHMVMQGNNEASNGQRENKRVGSDDALVPSKRPRRG